MKPVLTGLIVAGALAGGLLAAGPASSAQAAGNNEQENAAPLGQRMEAHWQRLVQERDVERRRALIAEHRKLLDEVRTAFGPAPNGGTGTGGQPRGGMMSGQGRLGDAMDEHHRQDVQSIVELHSMMLDMMMQ